MAEVQQLEPTFSSNAQGILDSAKSRAINDCRAIVGVEYLAREICLLPNYAAQWAASHAFTDSDNPILELKTKCEQYFSDRPLLTEKGNNESGTNLPLSDTLQRVVKIACQMGSGTITSEYLMAAILADGTGVGADLFHRISRGRVNCSSALEAFSVYPGDFSRPDTSGGLWQEHVVSAPESVISSIPVPWFPTTSLADLRTCIPQAPTHTSNWLIPGRLLIGERPKKQEDGLKLVHAGVDTFVCLLEQFFSMYINYQYPAAIKASKEQLTASVTFVHCPLHDGCAPSESALVKIVEELKRRILLGHTIFVHCYGGHG